MSWITDLFKKKDTRPVRTEIIYRNELVLENMFVGIRSRRSLTIVTYVVKATDKQGKVGYKIKQNLPLCENPFYDGDYATNRTVERFGHSEWILAEEAIDKDKAERSKDLKE